MRTAAAAATAAFTASCAGSGGVGGSATVTPAVSVSSAPSMLQATWQSYARTFIKTGRVVDPRSGSNTTSEGQSYALLRAVWMNDRSSFDTVWAWTRDHLWDDSTQRFAWLWGASSNEVLSRDSAADADSDIALALVFAAHRWNDSSYTQWAQRVLVGTWSNDVATVNGTPYFTAGSWAPHGAPAGPVLNPSYFSPYAYRIFAAVDSSHPWMALVGSSYSALAACSQATLGAPSSAGLPPNWCVLDAGTGHVTAFAGKGDGTDYGYDAFRVMWRVALDVEWFTSPSARAYLAGQQFLRNAWQRGHALAPTYGHDGSVRASYDDPTVYGGDVGAFLGDTAIAGEILHQKLLPSFTRAGGSAYWGEPDNYYEQNWVWFGVALVTGQLVNLAAG